MSEFTGIDHTAGEPAPLLDQLAEARAKAQEAGTRPQAFKFPGWSGELVGFFTVLSKAERSLLEKAARERKLDRSLTAEQRAILASAHLVSLACRRVEFKGQPVPGEPVASGFTDEFCDMLGQPDPVTAVWEGVFFKSDDRFGRFCVRLNEWMEDPSRQVVGDDDPFDGI